MALDKLFGGEMSLSFEVFPPKEDRPLEPLLATLESLYAFKPDFISCTYGAGGTNKGRSLEICEQISRAGRSEPLAHFTCVGNTREGIARELEGYRAAGVKSVLALRGDLPAGWEGTRGDFEHSSELMEYIRELDGGLTIGAACYPEKHIAAPSLEADIDALMLKQSAGASFAVSQLCYDPEAYARFIERARKNGFSLPVAIGVMPVLSRDGLLRMTLTNGCSIPAVLSEIIGRYGDKPDEFKKAGREYTAALIDRFLKEDIAGIHLYTLNNRNDAAEVLELSSFKKRARRSL